MGGRPSARKIENLALMLRGAMEAQGRVGLMLNVRKEDLPAVLAVLPALNSPTVSHAQRTRVGGGQHDHRRAPGLGDDSAAEGGEGATGIVEYPLNKVVM